MKLLSKIIIALLLLITFQNIYAQREMEALKRSAIGHMRAGRYGEAIDLLNKYDIEYVYVGTLERERYRSVGLNKFADIMTTVFENDSVSIYQRIQ